MERNWLRQQLLVGLPVFLLLYWPATAGAQAASRPESDWNQLQQVRAGEKIEVVQTDFNRRKGRFLSFSEEALTLRIKKEEVGIRRENVLRVTRLEKNKRARNALIGLGVGAATGLIVGARLDHESGESGEHIYAFLFGIVGSGIGAGVGAAFPSHPTIYRAPRGAGTQSQNHTVPRHDVSGGLAGMAEPLNNGTDAGYRFPAGSPVSFAVRSIGQETDLSASANRPSWAALMAGAGRDANSPSRFTIPPVFGLVRGSFGTGTSWLGIQGSLGLVSEGGGTFGDGSVEGVVRLRRMQADTHRPVPYAFAGPGLFFAPGESSRSSISAAVSSTRWTPIEDCEPSCATAR